MTALRMLLYLATLLFISTLDVHATFRRPESKLRELGKNPYFHGFSRHGSPGGRKNLVKSAESKAVEDYLLPTSTYPLAYDLHIIPYMTTPPEKSFTFEGVNTITIVAAQATNTIVMHSWDLTFSELTVYKASDNSSVAVTSYDILLDDRAFLTINLGAALEAGAQYFVRAVYTGVINDEYYGFFRSSYSDEDGNNMWLAITDLEPAGARRFMPCYDQPDLKARMTFHMAREPGQTVLANMPVERDDGEPVVGLPGWEWVHFQQSPPISTYILCFSTNKFESITSLADARYKVWARPEVVQDGQYTTNVSPDIIKFFEQYTGIPFQLPKLDQIGVFRMFFGAMENWGLITYREPYVLFNPEFDSTWDLTYMVQTVAHEFTHQWFGNLVSPKWWSNIWLNEGFATHYEYQGTAAVGPDWQMDHQFVVDQMYSAFRRDIDSHPIYADVDSPDSISNIFDSISYNKAGCIVRFMVTFLGDDNFKIAINNYLTAKSYAAADQDDLFFHLAPLAPPMPNGVTFKNMMDTWTRQPGFPLVTVQRNYGAQTVTISQQRFGNVNNNQWVIPLTFTTGANPDFSGTTTKEWLLPNQTVTLNVNNGAPAAGDWLLLNIKQNAFYRVQYDLANWALIEEYMNLPGNAISIDTINRAQLLDDSMALFDYGLLPFDVALRMTKYLDQETFMVPWIVATDNFEYVRDRMYATPEGVGYFQDYMRRKMNLVFNTVNGFGASSGDPHHVILNRYTVTRWACNMQHSACNTQGSDLFQQWMSTPDPDNNNPITLDLKTPAYCAGQRRGGQAEYDFLLARYATSNDGSEQFRLLNAMGCAADTSLLQAYLEESLSTDIIRDGDAISVLEAVYVNPLAVDMCLNFLLQNWRQLESLYNGVGNGFLSLATKLNTAEQLATIRNFRNTNAVELGVANLLLMDGALDALEAHVDWNSMNLDVAMQFFSQN